jgi:isoleucyl-tRNA synthetase
VDLYCSGALATDLAQMGDELRFFFITSGARVRPLSEAPEDAETEQVNGQPLVLEAAQQSRQMCALLASSRSMSVIIPTTPSCVGAVWKMSSAREKRGVCLMAHHQCATSS